MKTQNPHYREKEMKTQRGWVSVLAPVRIQNTHDAKGKSKSSSKRYKQNTWNLKWCGDEGGGS